MKYASVIVLIALSIGTAQNVVNNHDFETWTGELEMPFSAFFPVDMPMLWFTSDYRYPGSAARTTDAHEGTYALQLDASVVGRDSGYAATPCVVYPGYDYILTGWTKGDEGLFGISWYSWSLEHLGDNSVHFPARTEYDSTFGRFRAPTNAGFAFVGCLIQRGDKTCIDYFTFDGKVSVGMKSPSSPRRSRTPLLGLRKFNVLGQIVPNPRRSGVVFETDEEGKTTKKVEIK